MSKIERAQIEIMAAAICYAGFRSEVGTRYTPLSYWRSVNQISKNHYRDQARAIIALVRTYPSRGPV